MTSNNVILLFGMPRSGTTWVGKILDSHPDTLYMHEPDSCKRMYDIPLFVEEEYSGEGCDELDKFVTELPSMRNAQVVSKLPVFKKSYQSVGRYYTYKMTLYVSSLCSRLALSRSLDPARRVSSVDGQCLNIVWKSIESLGRLPYFEKSIEKVTCIHIIRNPAGYISSVLDGEKKNRFQETSPSSDDYDLFEMLLTTNRGEALGYTLKDIKALSPVERLAIRWRLYNEIAYEQCRELANYRLLKYEDMCSNPVEMSKEYFEFCGLKWNDQSESFVHQSTTTNNDAYYSVFKDPLVSANGWQSKLDRSDIRKIADILSGSAVFAFYADDFKPFMQ